MQHINGAYTNYFDTKRKRSGHLDVLAGFATEPIQEKMSLMDNTIRYAKWLPLLAAWLVCGCTSLPEQKGIWPWEYGTGQGEPNTGDHAAIRAGVAKFGETPKAVKPITPESLDLPAPDAHSALATSATETAPLAESEGRADKTPGSTKKAYDFAVREKKSASASQMLLDTVGSIHDITAFNSGNAPVSVAVDVDQSSSQNTSADKRLPHYGVIPANTVRTLVRISPKRKDAALHFRYSYIWSIGDYTARHDCREAYRFPFGERVRAFASVSDAANDSPYTRYAVVFSVPRGTPVLAARKGTVIQIGPDDKIDILHDDSTIGTYSHLEKIAENIVVGKTVTTDDIVGIAGTAENNRDAYMQLTVWRPEPAPGDALQANARKIGFVAISFPLAFRSADSDQGKVLTQSQPVSRGKLPASKKQAKRK